MEKQLNQINTHWRNKEIKRAHASQVVRAKVRAKGNLKLSYGVPSQGQTSDTNQRIKALLQGRQ